MLLSESDIDANDIQVVTSERRKDEFRTPEIGMEFSSEAEANKFYENHANKIGFSVRKGKVHQ